MDGGGAHEASVLVLVARPKNGLWGWWYAQVREFSLGQIALFLRSGRPAEVFIAVGMVPKCQGDLSHLGRPPTAN